MVSPVLLSPIGLPLLPESRGLKRFPPFTPPCLIGPPPGRLRPVWSPAIPHALSASDNPFGLIPPLDDPGNGGRPLFNDGILAADAGVSADEEEAPGTEVMKAISI